MPIYQNTPKGRRHQEAFEIIDEVGVNPLREAITAARLVEDPSERCSAWISIASFIYAKPKQQIEHSGAVTLESILAGSWDQTPALPPSNPNT